MVCTVGTLQVFPGAVNVIPGKVEFIVELRNPTMEPMDQVIASVLEGACGSDRGSVYPSGAYPVQPEADGAE